jgi:hypothetical protein
VVGELIGALAAFIAQTVNPFARWAKRGESRRRGEERHDQEQHAGNQAYPPN